MPSFIKIIEQFCRTRLQTVEKGLLKPNNNDFEFVTRHQMNSSIIFGRILVYSDNDLRTAYGLAKQIHLTPLGGL